MSNELVRTNLETSLESSLDSLMKDAEVVMLLIDCSGSMDGKMRNGKRRIEGLREVVAGIKNAGHVPMIAFGGPYDAQVRFVDGVPEPDGGTPLHMAIPFAKEYGATRLVVISDGCPDLPEQSNIEAVNFGGKIDVVFVGDEGEGGAFFLEELAKLTGGSKFQGDLASPKELTSAVIGLLEGAVEPASTVIVADESGTAQVTEVADDEEFEEDADDDEDDEDDDEDDDE